MKIFVASPRGFCAGVVRAIDIVKLALEKYGAPIYMKHQIVHNQTVVDELEAQGVKTVEAVEDIPPLSNVVFSAHGSPPSDYAIAKKLKLNVVDATCPLVTKVHHQAQKYKREGRKIILIGHTGHQEVTGTSGHTKMFLIDERKPWQFPDWDKDDETAVLTQTTLSVNDTAEVVKKLQEKFKNISVRNDICYATTNRQKAVDKIVKFVSLVLVVGSEQSSNCTRLKEIAASNGLKSILIRNAEALNLDWLKGHTRIGITSGASTPEKDLREVIRKISPKEVIDVGDGPENIIFKLPQMPDNTHA